MLLRIGLIVTLCLIQFSYCTIYEWKQIEFVWPSDSERQAALREGRYNATNILPFDIDIQYRGKIFG